MKPPASASEPARPAASYGDTLTAYARGAAGGLLVGTPLLCTMEMWQLGYSMPPLVMLLFFFVNFGILLILEHYSGFREDQTFREEFQDAVIALGIGVLVSAVVLFLLNELRGGMGFDEILGKIILEAIPVSIGASVAIGQLGTEGGDKEAKAEEKKKREAGYWGEMAMALAGAVFFGLNIAPTEEPMLIGLQMHWWQGILLTVLTLMIIYGLTYALEFQGGSQVPEEKKWWHVLLRDSISTYGVALVVATYLLWSFGRIDGKKPETYWKQASPCSAVFCFWRFWDF